MSLRARRSSLGLTALLALACAASGCSQLSFGSYESFDAWYVGRDEGVQASELGFSSLDGNVAGYLINDVLIRTPAALVEETSYLLLTPVALPYYGARSLFGGNGEAAGGYPAPDYPAPHPAGTQPAGTQPSGKRPEETGPPALSSGRPPPGRSPGSPRTST